jgi:hypothetical protein
MSGGFPSAFRKAPQAFRFRSPTASPQASRFTAPERFQRSRTASDPARPLPRWLSTPGVSAGSIARRRSPAGPSASPGGSARTDQGIAGFLDGHSVSRHHPAKALLVCDARTGLDMARAGYGLWGVPLCPCGAHNLALPSRFPVARGLQITSPLPACSHPRPRTSVPCQRSPANGIVKGLTGANRGSGQRGGGSRRAVAGSPEGCSLPLWRCRSATRRRLRSGRTSGCV